MFGSVGRDDVIETRGAEVEGGVGIVGEGASQLRGVDHCVVVDECVYEVGNDSVADGKDCFLLLLVVLFGLRRCLCLWLLYVEGGVLKGDFTRRGRVRFLYVCVVRVRFWHGFVVRL